MKINFEMDGVSEAVASLTQIAQGLPGAVGDSVERVAEEVKEKASENAPEATGALRRSGEVEMVDDTTAIISFGGELAPYAVVIHEHPDFDPPSWEGKVIVFKPEGTGQKFLERAIADEQIAFAGQIAADLEMFLARFSV